METCQFSPNSHISHDFTGKTAPSHMTFWKQRPSICRQRTSIIRDVKKPKTLQYYVWNSREMQQILCSNNILHKYAAVTWLTWTSLSVCPFVHAQLHWYFRRCRFFGVWVEFESLQTQIKVYHPLQSSSKNRLIKLIIAARLWIAYQNVGGCHSLPYRASVEGQKILKKLCGLTCQMSQEL